jgi:nicotinamidase/pyrazinamidase
MTRALLVVDLLHDFIADDGALPCGEAGHRAVAHAAQEIRKSRARGESVIYACDAHLPDDKEFLLYPPHCLRGSEGARVVPEVAPEPGDVVLHKRRFIAFFGTDLDLVLRERGVDTLRIVGVCTNICVYFTAAEAAMRGFRLEVPMDAVASFDAKAHAYALTQLRDVLKADLLEGEA